jgi:hypothetical protein
VAWPRAGPPDARKLVVDERVVGSQRVGDAARAGDKVAGPEPVLARAGRLGPERHDRRAAGEPPVLVVVVAVQLDRAIGRQDVLVECRGVDWVEHGRQLGADPLTGPGVDDAEVWVVDHAGQDSRLARRPRPVGRRV